MSRDHKDEKDITCGRGLGKTVLGQVATLEDTAKALETLGADGQDAADEIRQVIACLTKAPDDKDIEFVDVT